MDFYFFVFDLMANLLFPRYILILLSSHFLIF